MGLFNLFKKGNDTTVVSPCDGMVEPLTSLNDGVFSDELLGKGCVVKPNNNDLYSPFDGEVVMTTPTKHAIGLKSTSGIEVLIHIGIDTVTLEGKPFTYMVKKGDRIHKNQQIMEFDRNMIQSSGLNDGVIVIVSNTNAFEEVKPLSTGSISHGEPLIETTK